MATVEELRTSFDKMTMLQKKAFIERLRLQLKGKNTPFLNECVQKYNAAARSGSPVSVPTAAAVPMAATSKPKSSLLKWVIVCLALVVVIGGGVLAYAALNGSGGLGNSNLVGEWHYEDKDIQIMMQLYLNEDGSYRVHTYTLFDYLNGTLGSGNSGTYKVQGKKLILTNNGGLIEEYTISGNRLTSENGRIVFEKQRKSDTNISDSKEADKSDELVDAYIEILKSGLKDPSSLQVHEVRLRVNLGSIVSDEILIDYSAKNGFGGTNREIAWITPRGIEFSSDDISGSQVKDIWKNKSKHYR